MHRRLQMVSVLRICRNFLQTRATFGRAVPGSRENISTKSSGGKSANDCGCGSPVLVRNGQFLLRTWLLPYSQASLGPAVAMPLSGPPPLPTTSPCLWPTMRSSPSSSMSESLARSSWLCRCLLLHRRDWPTPQSLAQTAIRSRQAGDITSQQNTAISCSRADSPPTAASMDGDILSDVTTVHVKDVAVPPPLRCTVCPSVFQIPLP